MNNNSTWDSNKAEWVLTGFMSFDRPPIIHDEAPDEHPDFPGKPLETGDFWFDTTTLEVLINYNGQWFPVSIPPAQVETLRQAMLCIKILVRINLTLLLHNKNLLARFLN